jgi:hypothetical protein
MMMQLSHDLYWDVSEIRLCEGVSKRYYIYQWPCNDSHYGTETRDLVSPMSTILKRRR